ncbi:right-handed parallel beta-helix repeat-containing protein [Lysinibacillus sp. UGB7]|uniref:right-handed parallel beta-helix repeat-containing protein n=1 Tax=Lysinibacillus sp. UGB7 TaxID=3411039 RepID=UPI003B80A0C6
MKKISSVLLFFLVMSQTVYADFDVQEAIDAAKPGAIISIPTGHYKGNFVLTKKITLRGEQGTELVALGNEPVLRIDGSTKVTIENMTLSGTKQAIVASDVDGLELRHLKMKDIHAGVHIQRSKNVRIQHIEVTGKQAHYSKKGNGLAIFQSEDVVVEDANINHVQDGIYVEEVKNIRVQNNTIANSRYGMHFMYSSNAQAFHNTYQNNVTGLMIMMTSNISIKGNHLANHNGLNSYSMLLYDVQQAVVELNTIKNNRTGVALQKSTGIHIASNDFQMNQTALEGTKVDGHSKVTNNQFTGNILTARSDHQGFLLSNNYYDDYAGIDLENDGMGDVPYVAVSSFGQWMVRQPVYQYFVASPSVVLLTSLDQQINKTEKSVLVDVTPKLMMDQITEKSRTNIKQLLLGFLIIIASVWLWRRGMME